MHTWELIRSHAGAIPTLAKFAIGMALIVCVPPLFRRVRLPAVVGLFLAGVLVGPHGMDILEKHAPIADFFGDLGKLLLMFFAGLETDLALFRKARKRIFSFGPLTTITPLLLGTAVGILFGYHTVAAIVMGSLLASHTLLSNPIITKMGLNKLEPMVVTNGATVISDTLSLLVFAVCVPTIEKGFAVGSEMLYSIIHDYALIIAVIAALLLGKFIAAEICGRAFGYSSTARMTVWALTLPQVAATLAAALVAYDTYNSAHERLLDARVLNVVLVLMLTTSILGPVMTAHFGEQLKKAELPPKG